MVVDLKRLCKHCNKEFTQSSKQKKYCSLKCSKLERLKQKEKYRKKFQIIHPERIREYNRKWYQSKGKEYVKQYMQKNREKFRKYWQLWKENRRLEIINKLGGKCIKCGYTNNIVLQFHHINPENKEPQDWMIKNFDISKIILLCANCHIEEHEKLRMTND